VITCVSGSVELEPRLTCGSFRYEHRSGYPMLTPSTVAPESLLGRLRSSSPRALGGVFDPFEGYTAFSNGISLDLPFLQKSSVLEEGL